MKRSAITVKKIKIIEDFTNFLDNLKCTTKEKQIIIDFFFEYERPYMVNIKQWIEWNISEADDEINELISIVVSKLENFDAVDKKQKLKNLKEKIKIFKNLWRLCPENVFFVDKIPEYSKPAIDLEYFKLLPRKTIPK